MELQRTSSIAGPLSPAYTGQVPYNYNQLEGRFKQLQDEREAVQKKTFTKWVNSHLARVSCRITDLYADLRDGRMLIKLLEVLSGERLVSVGMLLSALHHWWGDVFEKSSVDFPSLNYTING